MIKIDSLELLPIENSNFKILTTEAILRNNRVILNEGNYILHLSLKANKNNEGDILGIYNNDSILSFIHVPIGVEEDVDINLTLDITDKDTVLSITNESDDFITMENLIGGLYMSDQLKILNVNNFNPFSFDLELNVPFTEDIEVEVKEVCRAPRIPSSSTMATKVVDKLNLKDPAQSTEGNPNLKTVIVTDNTKLFEVNTIYHVTVYSGQNTATGDYSFNFTTFPMMNQNNCTVHAVGTRLIIAEFDYPVKNLGAVVTDTDPGSTDHTELNNFYISYYGVDTNLGEMVNIWAGDIDIIRTEGTGASAITYYPFSATVSADNRRLEIQSNLGNFNTGGTNKLSINFTKHQDFANQLTDYSNRPIANFEKTFTCTRNTVAAEIEDVGGIVALSNHEVQVTFNSGVCLPTSTFELTFPQYFNISKIDGSSVPVSIPINRVERVGNGFNEILYTLDGTDVTKLLPIPSATIVVGTVLDASGLETLPVQATINVPPTTPRFIMAVQEGKNDYNKTKIRATFNETMNIIPNGINSAINTLNYILKGPLGEIIVLDSITPVSGTSNMEFIITVNYVLTTGTYVLTALETICDFVGVHINTKSILLQIIDYISPGITKILATTPTPTTPGTLTNLDNGMVIVFDKPMNVTQDDRHSVLRQTNYIMEYLPTSGTPIPYILDSLTTIVDINKSMWIRYTFPTPTTMPDFTVPSDYNIHVGYVDGPYIKHVNSQSGNVYPLCTPGKIDYLVKKLDIANGVATITSTNTIEYKLSSSLADSTIVNNLFYNVSASDFQAIFVQSPASTNTAVEPINYVLDTINFNKIIFTFPDNSFTSTTSNVKLVTKYIVSAGSPAYIEYTANTVDIFGKGILRSTVAYTTIDSGTTGVGLIAANNQIPTAVQGIGSLLNISTVNKTADIELNFGKNISVTNRNDFDVYYKDPITGIKQDLVIGAASVASVPAPNNTNPVRLTGIALPSVNYTVIDNLFVNTVPDAYPSFTTKDSNGNYIKQFFNLPVGMLKVQNFTWTYVPAVTTPAAIGDKYKLVLTFNKPISTQYAGIPATTTTPVANPPYVVTVASTASVATVNIGNAARKVELGQFSLAFTGTPLSGLTLAWQAEGITLSPDGYVLTIVLQNTTPANALFTNSSTATRTTTGSIYKPVATVDAAYSAAIVDKDDTIRLDIIDKDLDTVN
ncbi:MAG: hypothetical protein RSA29_02200 [Clostridium sp.]|uniref:hypothetical protein n=1 Tax=Clostridium sp. TaxID=1506 RepID=UPI003034EAC5